MTRPALIAIALLLTGCAETGAFLFCSMGNARGQNYSGYVNDRKVSGSVNWTARPGDPGYVEPVGCMETMATNFKRAGEGKQNCTNNYDCASGKCLPDPAGGHVCQ